jgi:basic membrane protein A
MKRSVVVLFGLLGCAITSAQQGLQIGVVYGDSVKLDRSFNQRTFEGTQRAAKDFGLTLKEFIPQDPTQIEGGARQLAQGGATLVIGVGFSSEAGVSAAAKDFPGTKFAVIDAVPQGSNSTGLLSRENEGSYLVGYIAGVSSSTGVVGFIGGMDIPLIHKFEAGYRAGVLRACPTCKVVSEYVGSTPTAWNNPSKAKEIAARQVGQGADIVYAAAGGSGSGALDYVKSKQCLKATALPGGLKFRNPGIAGTMPKPATYAAACAGNARPLFFIGVDSNQNYLGDTDKNPKTMNFVLTSMEKRVDNSVYKLISDFKSGAAWKSGPRDFGLKEFGVGYAVDEYNQGLIPAALVQKIAQIKAAIVSGRIVVPKER